MTVMRQRVRRLAGVAGALAVVSIALGGCAAIAKRFVEPEVAFRGVTIKGLGMTGGSLDVLLQVYNPNGFALDASRLTYKLMVDSLEVGSGATDHRFRVASKDSATVALPIDFKWSGLGEAGRQLMNSGSVNYRVLGDLTVGSALGNYTIPFDRTGRYSTLSGASR